MALQAVEAWTSPLKDQTPAIALIARRYSILKETGDVTKDPTILRILPALRVQPGKYSEWGRELQRKTSLWRTQTGGYDLGRIMRLPTPSNL